MVDAFALVHNALGDEQFIRLPKKLMRYFKGNADAASFLVELVGLYTYHLREQSVDPDDSFPLPIDRVKRTLGFSSFKQTTILTKLSENNLITLQRKDYPAKRYVSLNFEAIASILATDDLAAARIEKQSFYDKINAKFNVLSNYDSIYTVTDLAQTCDNMAYTLKGVIILISREYLQDKDHQAIAWNPELIGKIRQWANKKMIGGKAFDFSSVERIMKITKRQPGVDFKSFISLFLMNSKEVHEVHMSEQIYDYLEVFGFPDLNDNYPEGE